MKLPSITHESARYTTKHFIVLALIPCAIKISAKVIPEEEVYSNTTSQCLLNIIHKYLHDSKKITLRYDNTRIHLAVVDQLFRSLHVPIMSNADEVPIGIKLDTRIPSDVSIILGESTNITRYLASNLFTSRTVFLTVLWIRDTSETVRGVFNEFWKYNVVNTFVLVVGEDEIDVYYSEPFTKCNESEPMVLDKWSDDRFVYGKIERVKNRYPVSDMNGCLFNVTVTNVPPTIIFPNPDEIHGSYVIDGIEGRILKTIAEKLNGTFRYKIADDGENWGFVNPSPRGAIGELSLKKSIITCGLTAQSLERFSYFDGVVSTSAESECIAWLVPEGSGRGKPVWIRLYISEFSLLTWLLLSLCMILMLACSTLFSWIEKSGKSMFENFIIFYSSSLGVSITPPKSGTLKILFAAWIWYGLVVQTAYESSVKSRLTVPVPRKNIDTFRELLESDLELYGICNTIRLIFQGNEDPDSQALGKRVKGTTNSVDEIVEKMVNERLIGYLREHTTFLYNAYKNRKAIGEIHRVKSCAMEYYPTLYLQKRYPVTHIVKRVVTQLLETGILYRWRQSFLREVSTKSKSSDHIKLTLRHMTAPFIAYLAGLSLSTAAFILEYLAHFYVRTYKMKRSDRLFL